MKGEWKPSPTIPNCHEYIVHGVIVGRAQKHWNGKMWYSEIRIIHPNFQYTATDPVAVYLESLAEAQQQVEAYWSTHDMSHLIPETTQLSLF